MKEHVEGEAIVEPCPYQLNNEQTCSLTKGHGGPHRIWNVPIPPSDPNFARDVANLTAQQRANLGLKSRCEYHFRGGLQCILPLNHEGGHQDLSDFRSLPLKSATLTRLPLSGGLGNFPYDEGQVLEFVNDIFEVYLKAGLTPDRGAGIWLGRMQFDAITEGYPAARQKHLNNLRSIIGNFQPQPIKPPVPPVDPDLTPRQQFMEWVKGKVFAQHTLENLEPTMNAAGWELTGPNALGQRTKVRPPYSHWFRVGFGEGDWVWVDQGEPKT